MAKRARTEKREAARAAEKLALAREKLAKLEPGGAPDRPIDVMTASVIESHARAAPCLRCGEGGVRVEEHEARGIDGRRLRVVRLACPQCGARRAMYFGSRRAIREGDGDRVIDHLSLGVPDLARASAFYDEGAPGLRPECGPGYYAAFVRDPDGYRLEAVCHEA